MYIWTIFVYVPTFPRLNLQRYNIVYVVYASHACLLLQFTNVWQTSQTWWAIILTGASINTATPRAPFTNMVEI